MSSKPASAAGSEEILLTAVQRLAATVRDPIEARTEISVDDLWSQHGPTIWKAHRFAGSPSFYPVYKYGDLYSYSLISLILHKGVVRLNRRVARQVARPGFYYYSGTETIDREITRVGGSPRCGFAIKSADEYARRIADAMRCDTGAIESLHPGFTNVVLCGGKDSCNLLLLPWKNPVVVASAPPNYELVKGFVAANGLRLDVIKLDDSRSALLPLEILMNCCRNNLEHCRWGEHLREIAGDLHGRLIFWKGQAGDTIMTPFWKRYRHPPDQTAAGVSRIRQALSRYRRHLPARLLEATGVSQRLFFRSLWSRGAMSLGAHMSFIRQLTDALVLSAYHGPAMQRVLSQVDLYRTVQQDIRPLVGQHLFGQPVMYAATNPGPPVSTQRRDASHLEPFLSALAAAGIPVDQ